MKEKNRGRSGGKGAETAQGTTGAVTVAGSRPCHVQQDEAGDLCCNRLHCQTRVSASQIITRQHLQLRKHTYCVLKAYSCTGASRPCKVRWGKGFPFSMRRFKSNVEERAGELKGKREERSILGGGCCWLQSLDTGTQPVGGWGVNAILGNKSFVIRSAVLRNKAVLFFFFLEKSNSI